MDKNRKNQVLIDLDDPNIETQVSRDSTTTTNVEHSTVYIESIDSDQTEFKSKFEEAQLNLFDLEKELRLTRDKLNTLQGACENTEEKLSLLKDATFSYQSIVSRHEITFKTITEENRVLKIQLSKMQDLEKELDEERDKNSVLSDRVMVLERVKEHANEEIDRLTLELKEVQSKSDADIDALRDKVKEYEDTCENLQNDLDQKEEELIRLKLKHESDVGDLNTALKQKHDDYIVHAEKSETLAAECDILRKDKATGEENLLREIESLKLKYDQIDGEKGTLEKEKEEIYNELNGLEERLQDLEKLQAERFELKKDNDELRIRIEMLAKENKDLEDKKAELLDKIDKLEDRLKDFDALQDDRDDIVLQLQELKRKYDEVLAENSDFCDKFNRLDDENSRLRIQLDDLKIKFESLQKEKRELEDNERKQKNKINELERELRTAKREKDDLADRFVIEKGRAEESTKKVTELKARIRELENDIREKDKKVQELDDETKKMEEELDNLNDTLEKGRAAYDNLNDKAEDLEDENEKLRQELEELKAKQQEEVIVVEEAPQAACAPVVDLTDDLEAANNDKKRLQEDLDKMKDKYDFMYEDFTKKIKILEDRCETLKQEIIEKEMIIAQLRREEIRYQERIKELEQKLENTGDLSNESDVLRKQIIKLEEEIQFLTEELKNTDDISINEIAELEKEVKALKAKIQDYERQAKDDEKEIERVRKRSKVDDDWKTQYNSLKIQFDSLERERDFIKRDKDRLHKEYTEVDDELQNIRSKHSRTKKQLDEANIEINTLRIRVTELERSQRPETHRKEIAELKRIINDKEEEIEELKHELQGIDGEEWPQKYESLKLKYEEVDDEKDSLVKEKSELQKELRTSAEKVAELEIRLNNGTGDERRLREEVRTLRSKISELERDRRDDQRTIEKLRKRIAELEDEIKRLKELLKKADNDNKKNEDLQKELNDLEKEVILLTTEVEDKSTKIKDLNDRIKELEQRPEPELVKVDEQILSQSRPDGGDYPFMDFEPIANETSNLIIDVMNYPEMITLGVLLRSKQRGLNRVPIRGRMLSEYEFTVEPLPGTVLVGQPISVKVDVKETPSLQHPDRIDGEHISPDMVEVSESVADPLLAEPERSPSPVALVLTATEVSPSQAQIIDIGEPDEQPTGAFQPVPQRDQSLNVPRGKLVPIRAVIRDNTAVVQKAEPTMLSPDDSVFFDDRNFKPVDIGRSKSFHAGDIGRQQPEPEPGYSNGYGDDVIYPRELYQRYQEEREVKAVKPSEFDPRGIDYNQNVDDGVKREKTWKSVEELSPLERHRLSTAGSEKDLGRQQEPVMQEMKNEVQESAPMLESTPTEKRPEHRHSVDERRIRQQRQDHRDGGRRDDRRRPDDRR